MGAREEAIKQILDEGADMTDENINSVMKSMKESSGTKGDMVTEKIIKITRKKKEPGNDNKDVVKSINQMQDNISGKIDQLIQTINSRQDRPINVPEIKIPDIHLPEIKLPQIIVPEQKAAQPLPAQKKKFNFEFTRDVNGNIINVSASEE